MMIAYLYVWQTDQQWHCYRFDRDTNNIDELSMDKDFLIKARKDSTEDVKYIRKAAQMNWELQVFLLLAALLIFCAVI